MQLAITALGSLSTDYLSELLAAIRDCKAGIVDIRSSCLAQTRACYLLVQGNWNQIAKLENALDNLHKHSAVQMQFLRTETHTNQALLLPYVLETFAADKEAIVESLSHFLIDREVFIEDIIGNQYSAAYSDAKVFSLRLLLLIPAQTQLLALREDLLDYCDQLNLDALFEPIKR